MQARSSVHLGNAGEHLVMAHLLGQGFAPESGHSPTRFPCPLSAISGHLLVRLLAVNGKRKLAACSLVEGRWPTQAADASWPRS